MQTIGIFSFVARKLGWPALALSLVQLGFSAPVTDPVFPVLNTRTATYTNVTVTTRAKNYIFITHSAGMANIKIQDLPDEIQQKLGYAVASEKAQVKGPITKFTAQTMPAITQKLKPLEKSWRSAISANQLRFHLNAPLLYLILAGALLTYLSFCYCCHLICVKAKAPASALVWVPGFQMIPLLRAAGMSRWWFLGYLVPVLSLVVWVLWCLNIVKAREKSGWIAIGLMIPGISLIAFLFLAFSSGALKLEAVRYQSMSLQTA